MKRLLLFTLLATLIGCASHQKQVRTDISWFSGYSQDELTRAGFRCHDEQLTSIDCNTCTQHVCEYGDTIYREPFATCTALGCVTKREIKTEHGDVMRNMSARMACEKARNCP